MQKQETAMQRILGFVAVCIALAGCSRSVITTQAGDGVQHIFTCQFLQEKALDYAIMASRQLGMPPTFIHTNGFSATTSDLWGMPTKVLDVTLWPKEQAATGIIVHVNASNGAEGLANDFTAAFAQVSAQSAACFPFPRFSGSGVHEGMVGSSVGV
jgi:hypothetical protein